MCVSVRGLPNATITAWPASADGRPIGHAAGVARFRQVHRDNFSEVGCAHEVRGKSCDGMGTKGYIDVLDVDCGRSPVSIEAVEQRLVWTLPTDATCAKRARDLVDDTLTVLGVDREVIRDAKLMVSELATNSYRHAQEHPP